MQGHVVEPVAGIAHAIEPGDEPVHEGGASGGFSLRPEPVEHGEHAARQRRREVVTGPERRIGLDVDQHGPVPAADPDR
ncbi:hypothetical protein SR39_30490 [Methylobacterium radiotolerans]|nr:hypothetical protein SR39_30490 [Methylobacterium radiotolerans]